MKFIRRLYSLYDKSDIKRLVSFSLCLTILLKIKTHEQNLFIDCYCSAWLVHHNRVDESHIVINDMSDGLTKREKNEKTSE